MNIKQIQIQTKPMQLEYKTNPSSMEISQGNPIKLDFSVKPGSLKMHSEQVKVLIDQTQCFAEAGLKNIQGMIDENTSISKQKMMESIGKIVEQGNELADIASGNDPIPAQAEYNAFDQFIREWNFDLIPKSRPEFKVTGGTVDIEHEPAEVQNNTRFDPPKINYTAGKIETYVKQYNEIEMSTVDAKI